MKFTNTYKRFSNVSQILIKGLRDALKLQEYYATGKLSRSFVGIQEKAEENYRRDTRSIVMTS